MKLWKLLGRGGIMKIHCNKCNKQLTQDLYYVPNKNGTDGYMSHKTFKRVYTSEHGVGYSQQKYRMKKGVFFIEKSKPAYNHNYDTSGIEGLHQVIKRSPDTFVVGERSFIDGIIPDFKSGWGCCNYNMGSKLSCDCGNGLGEMFLDCFEDGRVELHHNKIKRVYWYD